jgi:recombination protein RecR
VSLSDEAFAGAGSAVGGIGALGAPGDGRALQRLLDELGRLPGIGPKSAQRIAYYLLEADAETARRLADAILRVKEQVHFCPICFNYATREHCDVCDDPTRDRSRICVVSEPRDVQAIERTGSFHGLYHVLGGVISPMDKVGPEQLHVRELLGRLADGTVGEVILATNPDVEGETTATYLSRIIRPLGVEVTRLASGLPVGGDLEYADEVTLGRAIEARRAL